MTSYHWPWRSAFGDPRLVTARPLEVGDDKLKDKLGAAQFSSATYRLFKLQGLENGCENYGQTVIYRGGIDHCEDGFCLDAHHEIPKGAVFPVCGNTWRMLADTRFRSYFEFVGNFDHHYGMFPSCGSDNPFSVMTLSSGRPAVAGAASSGSCC